MRIIVWGINYAPELTGIAPFNTGLCDFLRERGHQVEMVTTFPYYPSWRKVPGDSGLLFRTDELDGVWIHRCWHYVPSRATTLRRIWHELSFGLTSLLRTLFLARADVYVVVSPPLMLGLLASFVCWLKRRPYVFHVQDLQPDAAVGLGMVTPGQFTRLLYRVEGWAYRHASMVSGISEGMIAAFTRKQVPASKRVLFPNWIRWYARNAAFIETEADARSRGVAFRQKFGIPDHVFLASYSGNLGRKQGLDTLLAAAELIAQGNPGTAPLHETSPKSIALSDLISRSMAVPAASPPFRDSSRSLANVSTTASPVAPATPPRPAPSPVLTPTAPTPEILILIVGDGVMRRDLETRIEQRALTNVRMMPLLLENDYHGMLAASDVSLILQAPGTGQYFFPSKLLSVLSTRSPVLTAADADSELAKAVDAGGFGVNIPAAHPEALASTLQELAATPERLSELRERTTWVSRFTGEKVLREFEALLLRVANR